MGIPGLLNALKDVTRPVHIRDFQGLKAGVDASCWLHRGVYCCSNELMEGVDSNKYVEYCLERLSLLQKHGVEPVVVFDGRPLPAKAHTHQLRRSAREENRERAEKALQDGSKSLAQQFFQKSLEITHEMSHKLVLELQARNIQVIVAPYEADAQLAFLSKNGLIDFVITEDSDTIPFGCKRCLFKMDKEGYGQEIQRKHLGANGDPSFLNWSDDMFLLMCVLAGCDYLPKIPQLGLKTAHRLVQKHRTQPKLLAALRSSKFEVPAGYETMFEEARLTFRHQTVFDPVTQKLVPMSPLPYHLDGQELAFLGPMLPLEVAVGIANGQLHPYTFEEFQAPAAIPESAPPAAAAEATKPDEAEQAQDVDFPAANPLPPPSILLPPPHASSSSSSSSTVHVHTTYEHTTFRPKWHAEEPAAVAADDTPGLYDWDVPDVGDADSQPSVPAVPQPPPPVIQRVQLQQCPASFPLNMLHFSSPFVNSNLETLHRRKRRLGSNPSSEATTSSSQRDRLPSSPLAGHFFDRAAFSQTATDRDLIVAPAGRTFGSPLTQRRRSGSSWENDEEYVNTMRAEINEGGGGGGGLLLEEQQEEVWCASQSQQGLAQFRRQHMATIGYETPQFLPVSHPTKQESRESYWDRVLGRDL